MKMLIRPKSNYLWDGYLEWSPGRNKWYPISQVHVISEDKDRFINQIKKLHDINTRHRRMDSLPVEGYYDQVDKKLHITFYFSKGQDLGLLKNEEDEIMYDEDLIAIDFL